jgi:hypothetical protein
VAVVACIDGSIATFQRLRRVCDQVHDNLLNLSGASLPPGTVELGFSVDDFQTGCTELFVARDYGVVFEGSAAGLSGSTGGTSGTGFIRAFRLVFAAEEIFWQLVVEGVLAAGMNSMNPNHQAHAPSFRTTLTRFQCQVQTSGLGIDHQRCAITA